jgi:dTDP-4-amino-4,6-dideoxy-D-galactose acyltransferase
LAYWACDLMDKNSIFMAHRNNGLLVDNRITYEIQYEGEKIVNGASHFTVESYENQFAEPELIELALQSGHYSRFRFDDSISTKQFDDLYRTWIYNSIRKKIADKVFVYRNEQKKICGMVTVSNKKHIGSIGLISVEKKTQRNSIGSDLIRSAHRYFVEEQCHTGQVITQLANKPACKLYEKCGFKPLRFENVFHFWLLK